MAIIDKDKISEIVQIAKGYDSSRFERYINEALELDLKPLVCDSFYVDLLKNYVDVRYQNLLNGQNYEYEGLDYCFAGLNTVISYFVFARYCYDSPIVSTSHGRVIKETSYSSPTDLKQRKDDYHRFRHDAMTYFKDVEIYLQRNEDLFPEFFECSGCETTRNKIIVVK